MFHKATPDLGLPFLSVHAYVNPSAKFFQFQNKKEENLKGKADKNTKFLDLRSRSLRIWRSLRLPRGTQLEGKCGSVFAPPQPYRRGYSGFDECV